MNRRILLLLLILMLTGRLQTTAQNLVTNPGFELKNHCPVGRSEIAYTPYYDYFHSVIDWISPLYTSPDYFHRCGLDSSVAVPYLSIDGFHEPHGGDAFAGISMISSRLSDLSKDYWAEYLETRLSTPLIAGHDYYISYFVCLTNHGSDYFYIAAIDNIGARLTVKMLDTVCTRPMFFLSGPADIETPTGRFITDTSNWSLVSGIYHAKGGERWLTLGAFFTGKLNARILSSPPNAADTVSANCYMLVDDVCVTDMTYPTITDTTVYTPQFPVAIGQRQGGIQYKWNTEDTSSEILVHAPGDYDRQRWNDCSYSVDHFHVVQIPVESCVWLPSAFTPNGDGQNDLFGPGNINCQPDLQNFSFTIFSRWGQIVFQSNNPGEKWDGTFNGAPQEIGVYPYILKYSITAAAMPRGKVAPNVITTLKGDVTLIR
jgi:gliding motility-associated-like protein